SPLTTISTLFPYTTLFRSQTEKVYESEISYDSTDAHNHTLWLDGVRINAQSWTNNETVYVFTDSGRDEITLIDIMAHVGEESARSEEHTSELQSRENLVCR